MELHNPNHLTGGNTSYSSSHDNALSFPCFQLHICLTVATKSYELNNLGNEDLDAPVYNKISDQLSEQYSHENSQDFTSLPCETFLVACRTENDFEPCTNSFRHKNQHYQSVHAPLTTATTNDDDNIGKSGGMCFQ